MTTNAEIKKEMQELAPADPLIELYRLDATTLGGDVTYFTPGPLGGAYIVFNGIQYAPIPVESEGFEFDGKGKMPRPLIRVSNISAQFLGLINEYQDLIGAKVTRTRTYTKYLDSGSEPDPSAVFPADIFYIERKTRQNKFVIEWELKAAIDIQQTLIPKGQALEMCTHSYRVWDASEGEFIQGTCPYEGEEGSFDGEGTPTTDPNDRCSRRVFDCELRFPDDGTTEYKGLPTRAVPGIGKIGYPYR